MRCERVVERDVIAVVMGADLVGSAFSFEQTLRRELR